VVDVVVDSERKNDFDNDIDRDYEHDEDRTASVSTVSKCQGGGRGEEGHDLRRPA